MLLYDRVHGPAQTVGIHLLRAVVDEDTLGRAGAILTEASKRSAIRGRQRLPVACDTPADRSAYRLLVVRGAHRSLTTAADHAVRITLQRHTLPIATFRIPEQ